MNFYRSTFVSTSDNPRAYTAVANNTAYGTKFIDYFYGNSSFNSDVVIGSNVINCRGLFGGCSNFNSNVEFSNGSVPKNIECAEMFAYCYNFDKPVKTNRVITNAYQMFFQCQKLNGNIDLKINGNINNMFYGSRLNHDVVLDLNYGADCSRFFYGLGLNHNVTVKNAGNCYEMFKGCSYLYNNVSVIGSAAKNCMGMFEGCGRFLGNVIITQVADGTRVFANCSPINNVSLTFLNNNINMAEAFSNCKLLNQSFSINVNRADYIFRNCTNLNAPIDLTANYFNGAFMGCEKLNARVNLKHKFPDPYLPDANNLFNGCYYFNQDFTLNAKNMAGAFENCWALDKNIQLSTGSSAPQFYGNNIFRHCHNLKQVTLPRGLAYLDNACSYCYNLTDVTMGRDISTSTNNMFLGKNKQKRLNVTLKWNSSGFNSMLCSQMFGTDQIAWTYINSYGAQYEGVYNTEWNTYIYFNSQL